jgi:hypothetical protein
LNDELNWQLPSVPNYTSVKNWLEKSGYYTYHASPPEAFLRNGYALIIDESMMIGSQKLLLTLGVSALKNKSDALDFGDVTVLDISVRASWNSESIGEVLERIKAKISRLPDYCVSDNASTIMKAVRGKCIVHHCDVGHSVALCLQHVYENDVEFKLFLKELNDVKSREVMRSTAYLLPPKQRSIARFMNLSCTVNWANAMLAVLPRLSESERHVFQFLSCHERIICELHEVFGRTDKILQRLKTQGLSYATANTSLFELESFYPTSSPRIDMLVNELSAYINKEKQKLPDVGCVRHISSDVIESFFGFYKRIQSPNPMNGITKRVLFLPLLAQMSSAKNKGCINFKKYLERVLIEN